MGKKKRSVLAEIKRTDKKKNKSQVELNSFVVDDREFEIVPPKSLKNPEKQLKKFALFQNKMLKVVSLPLVEKQSEELSMKNLLKEIAEKIQPHLKKYWMDSSLEEKRFLIMSYIINDIVLVSEILGEKDPSNIQKIFETKEDSIFTAFLNYYTFKEEIPELVEMFEEFWNFVETNLFE